MKQRAWRVAAFVLIGALFGAALYLLRRQLHGITYQDVAAAVAGTSGARLALAAVLTALGYGVLSLYDYFGLVYAGKRLPLRTSAPASFVSYALSNNVGLSIFGGMAFRFRLYTALGLSALDITKVVIFCAATFWVGILTLGGVTLLLWPPPTLAGFPQITTGYSVLGGLGLAAGVAYLVTCWIARGRVVHVGSRAFALPHPRLAAIQIAISAADWLCAASVLYVLLPDSLRLDFAPFLSLYVLASVIGLVSHVPGGLGVIEGVFMAALAGRAPASEIAGSLLVFRVVYYFAPMAAALALFFGLEARRQSARLGRIAASAQAWLPAVVPRVVAVATFVTGAILLFSGVTPDISERRSYLVHLLPLELLESFHVVAGVIGVALLVVARGLQKRLAGAYAAAVVLLLLGIVLSLAKGLDFEEAAVLSLAFAVLVPCRHHFYRKSSLFEARFSAGWITAIAATLGSMMWLMFFAYKHVEYSHELWWTFAFQDDAPRALRVAFASVSTALIVGIAYLLRPPRAHPPAALAPPDERALRIVRDSDKTYANLALLGDKTLLVNEGETALVMYGTEGRSWVAMGDPVGPAAERRELIWRFRDLCDRYDGLPAFYQVDPENLQYYVEAGLALLKIGEEALVDLSTFTLEGKESKGFRNTINRFGREGYVFEIVAPERTDALLPELERISHSWLASKKVKEKRFSLGFYSEPYLKRFPIAIVRRGDEAVAFANIWESASKAELSIDLMRFSDTAPHCAMDFLFVELMLWGKAQGYRWFNLGMAPFSGMEARPYAPLWSRLGATLYKYGEHFYNFKGLREYKEKFHPVWRAKFLASPPGAAVPIVLANIASLVAGGRKGVMLR